MSEQDQQDAPTFDAGDEALLYWAAARPDEWTETWRRRAALDGTGVVPVATLDKETDDLVRHGRYDEAMQAGIRAQMGPVVSVPKQPSYHSLEPRLQAELLRRGLAAQAPKP